MGVIYGNPEVTSGGQALKYYASVRWVDATIRTGANRAKVYNCLVHRLTNNGAQPWGSFTNLELAT